MMSIDATKKCSEIGILIADLLRVYLLVFGFRLVDKNFTPDMDDQDEE